MSLKVYWYLLSYNSLIIMTFIHQIVFGCFDLYVLLSKTIKSDMKPAQKIINNLMNKNRFHLKISSLRQDG